MIIECLIRMTLVKQLIKMSLKMSFVTLVLILVFHFNIRGILYFSF